MTANSLSMSDQGAATFREHSLCPCPGTDIYLLARIGEPGPLARHDVVLVHAPLHAAAKDDEELCVGELHGAALEEVVHQAEAWAPLVGGVVVVLCCVLHRLIVCRQD